MSKADIDRYHAAAHAMQSGVGFEMGLDKNSAATSPKHLRVGVNAAMVDHQALAQLLLRKGIITSDEYEASLAEAMEAEKARYEAHLAGKLGRPVTLG